MDEWTDVCCSFAGLGWNESKENRALGPECQRSSLNIQQSHCCAMPAPEAVPRAPPFSPGCAGREWSGGKPV